MVHVCAALSLACAQLIQQGVDQGVDSGGKTILFLLLIEYWTDDINCIYKAQLATCLHVYIHTVKGFD